jgi:hypothetical protein
MAQFRVVLDRVDLSADQHAELDRALQRTTLDFLAGLDAKGDAEAYYIPKIFRPPLAGIWIREIVEDGEIERFSSALDLDGRLDELNREIAGE